MKRIIEYVSKHNILDVEFLGRQNSVLYYQKASVFMMTSRSKGWVLTLTESQRFGVVPLAFKSYEAVSDIIINGENGYIIEDKNLTEYAERVLDLMSNEELRHRLPKTRISKDGKKRNVSTSKASRRIASNV